MTPKGFFREFRTFYHIYLMDCYVSRGERGSVSVFGGFELVLVPHGGRRAHRLKKDGGGRYFGSIVPK